MKSNVMKMKTAKRQKAKKGKSASPARVLANIQKNITAAARKIRQRIYKNRGGLTSDQVLAESGSAASVITQFLDLADAIPAALATARDAKAAAAATTNPAPATNT